jgi:mRNA interferase MazF
MGLKMINPKNIIRGSVWFVNLDPTMGHEQAKKRPCLVMSANTYNQGPAGLAVILPITSRYREIYWQVAINPPEGGLDKKSYVICDQIRSLSLTRFSQQCVGFVNDHIMEQIEERLMILLYFVPKE